MVIVNAKKQNWVIRMKKQKLLGKKAPEIGCCLPEECNCRAEHLEHAMKEVADWIYHLYKEWDDGTIEGDMVGHNIFEIQKEIRATVGD
jgi:hypothetical protein